MIGLYINNVEVPLSKGSYTEKRTHYQITGETEAGTNRRDLIRSNILGLSVQMYATDTEKATIEAYNEESTLAIKYYSGTTLITWDAYMDNLSCSAITDGEWNISFDLIDMEQ